MPRPGGLEGQPRKALFRARRHPELRRLIPIAWWLPGERRGERKKMGSRVRPSGQPDSPARQYQRYAPPDEFYCRVACVKGKEPSRSEEHKSELQSLMRTSYAVYLLKTKTK